MSKFLCWVTVVSISMMGSGTVYAAHSANSVTHHGNDRTRTSKRTPASNSTPHLTLDRLCEGRWFYMERKSELMAFDLEVKKTRKFEILFSDAGNETGKWFDISSGKHRLLALIKNQKQEAEPDTILSGCSVKGANLSLNGTKYKLERASGDLFEELKKRGINFSFD